MTTVDGPAAPATRCPMFHGVTSPAPVVDYDSHDRALAPDPFSTLARLRAVSPVMWSRAWSGFWVATGFAEVAVAARDRRFLTGHVRPDGTFQGISTPTFGQTGPLVPQELNPPESLPYRKLLSGFFSPSRVNARSAEFRALAAACVDEVIESGSCDIVDALTMRLPSILTLRDIGIPEERWAEINNVVERGLLCAPLDLDGARQAAQEACLEIVDAMEVHRDQEDGGLLSLLLRASIDGEPMADEAIVSAMYLLLLGIHPSSALVATTLWYLAKHPDLRRRLVQDRSLIPAAADEFVRWVSPIQSTMRTVNEDLHLGPQDVSAGDRVFMSWSAANRDEAVFPNGDVIDLDRETSGHLAFGGGVHYCIGASITRAMFTVMVDEVLRRMPDYELADESAIRWFPDVSFVYGVTSLPIVFTPGARSDRRRDESSYVSASSLP